VKGGEEEEEDEGSGEKEGEGRSRRDFDRRREENVRNPTARSMRRGGGGHAGCWLIEKRSR